LALEAAPVDFGQLELQPHELNATNSQGSSTDPTTASIETSLSGMGSVEVHLAKNVGPAHENYSQHLPHGIGHANSSEQVATSVQLHNSDKEGPFIPGALNIGHVNALNVDQLIEQGSSHSSSNVKISMVLLPKNIDIDPIYESFYFEHGSPEMIRGLSSESTRLWARYFARIGGQGG
jgi:hypothetical protein